jgi:hypothetical protein
VTSDTANSAAVNDIEIVIPFLAQLQEFDHRQRFYKPALPKPSSKSQKLIFPIRSKKKSEAEQVILKCGLLVLGCERTYRNGKVATRCLEATNYVVCR